MSTELCNELLLLVLQFLDEEKYRETLHRLESESGAFCNVDYIAELVTNGDWDVLENYLAGFINVNGSRHSVKMLFEIRKQRYIEALNAKDRPMALEILKKDLKPFKSMNEDVYKQMTSLIALNDIRENPQLSEYTDDKNARGILVDDLKKLIQSNPELRDKIQFPSVKASRLRVLVNQSLNWQHNLCRTPRPDPEITTILEDHVCAPPPQAAQAPAPVVNNQLTASMFRAGFLHQPSLMPPPEAVFLGASRGQQSLNPPALVQHPNMSGVLVRNNQNNADTEIVLRRSMHFGMSEEIRNVPTSSVARTTQSHHMFNFLPTDDVPKEVVSVINQGSEVKTMDFHPQHRTLLAVGTNTGDVSIWEIGNRMRIEHKNFCVWNITAYSMAIQATFNDGYPVVVNCLRWSPDGLFLGVAYSKHIVHVYLYRAGHELKRHLEIEAHAGHVSDLAFTIRHKKLIFITCGEDKTVKLWDATTGANFFVFEGHDAPVTSICPHTKDNVQYIFSTATDGKIKAWLHADRVSKIDYETPGYVWTQMAYSSDGSRFFSCGSREDRVSFLVEWAESQGTVKRQYIGLGKQHVGVMQFDTANRFLAAGDESLVKFWDMDNKFILHTTDADGGLPASPCVRFSKDGILLAVTTIDNGVKILANPEGQRLVKSSENHPEALRLASASAAKASNVNAASTSSAGTLTNIGFPDRSVPFPVMSTNQDNQNMSDVRGKITDEFEFPILWRPKEISEPSQLRSLRLPDSLLPVKVIRLMYTHSGSGVLALAYNAIHKLWRWHKSEQNPTPNATADIAPQIWQPPSGILMTNDIKDANTDDTIPSFALSKNNSYVLSASGGKISLFNLPSFKTMTSFKAPPPASTCLAFYPPDNNLVAIGMSDCSILMYNVQSNSVVQTLKGHQKPVTGLAFAIERKMLVSAGTDAELCVWSTASWKKVASKFLKPPSKRTNNSQAETRVHFNPDKTHFMAVHETQIAVYDPAKLDSCMQWVPRQASGSIADAVYSCDGQSIFVCVEDGSVSILEANPLKLKCRINCAAYMPSKRSAIRVSPKAIAAHPSDPNQLAIGLSDGGVYVLEPLKADKQWGGDPLAESSASPSINPDPNHT
ncbi:topless-related protein 4 [Helianthus annuus]|uniref:topless-related protein 4 n=1 Tax=Helianthus annuus TaxID=4232 RepID=UPI000B9035C5|nr:topless-related protein 4 [Helianthus annuus]